MKNHFGLIIGLFVLTLTPACAISKMPTEMPQKQFSGKFPAEWVEQLIFAHNDFKTTDQDISCFTVVMGWDAEEEYYFIAFLPTSIVYSLNRVGGSDECGRGISYRFNRSGKFVKRIFQR